MCGDEFLRSQLPKLLVSIEGRQRIQMVDDMEVLEHKAKCEERRQECRSGDQESCSELVFLSCDLVWLVWQIVEGVGESKDGKA